MCKTQQKEAGEFLADVVNLSATWTFMKNTQYLKKMVKNTNGISQG